MSQENEACNQRAQTLYTRTLYFIHSFVMCQTLINPHFVFIFFEFHFTRAFTIKYFLLQHSVPLPTVNPSTITNKVGSKVAKKKGRCTTVVYLQRYKMLVEGYKGNRTQKGFADTKCRQTQQGRYEFSCVELDGEPFYWTAA